MSGSLDYPSDKIGKWIEFQIQVTNSETVATIRRIYYQNVTQLILSVNYHLTRDNQNTTFVTVFNDLNPGTDFVATITKGDRVDYLSGSKLTSRAFEGYANFSFDVKLLIFKKQEIEVGRNIYRDLILNIPSQEVIIQGYDGQVPVNKMMLITRSPIIRALIESEDNLKIIKVSKQYNAACLSEFVNFVTTDELNKDTNHARQLLLLGHTYEIHLLKFKAQQLVIHNLNQDNVIESYKTFLVTCPDLLAEHLQSTFKQFQESTAKDKLDLSKFKFKQELANCWFSDFRQFQMTDVVLVAEDGEVISKKEILMARSSVFRATFSHDMKESRELRIEMKDEKKVVLEQFVQFLTNDEIDESTQHALELLLLADKYDVPLLKKIASQIVIENKQERNVLELYDVLLATNPELLEKHFVATFESFKPRSGLHEVDGRLFDTFTSKFF